MSWEGGHSPRETVQMIVDDIIAEVGDMEGKPFTGPVVAENFGIVRAQLMVLGKLVGHVFERLEELEGRMQPDDFMD